MDMDLDLDFKTQFYNLEGVHYNERKKNFSKLLRSFDRNILTQQLEDIQPRNYLEKIFYVDILIYLKQIDQLVKILTEGNGVLTSRILKQKWFFEEAFKTMTDEAIVNEFLPTLSYSVRMKVLKKIALSFNEQRMDNIFDYLLERYGLFIAQQFLFSCSPAKISQVVRNNKTTLSVEQLKRILNKDYHLIKIYIEEYKKNTGSDYNDHEFLTYLTWKYPNLYFEFQPFYKGAVKLGRQTTKAVLKINTEKALQDIDNDNIKKQFNIAAVTREVKDFDKDYLYKNFPGKIDQVLSKTNWETFRNFLNKYPHKRRWEVFSTAFKKAYNKDLVDHLKVVEETVAIMFPKEIKEKWAEIKYRETDDVSYAKYFDPKKAFELVKERINVTSGIYDRADMLSDLIKNCRTSKDYNIYEEVLKYILARHRNDDRSLRQQVIEEIQNDIDYNLTTEAFWSCVNQLVDVFRVKGESLPFKSICQYLIFAVKRELPLDELISQYVKDTAKQTSVSWSFNYLNDEPKIKAHILRCVMRYLSTIISESKRKTLTLYLMSDIVNFNIEHEDLAIDLNESQAIVELVRDVLVKKPISSQEDITCLKCLLKNNYDRKSHKPLKVYEESQILAILEPVFKIDRSSAWDSIILNIIKKPRITEFQHSLLEYYFTKYISDLCYYYNRKSAFKYFSSVEPEVLAKYIDHILPVEAREAVPTLEYSILRRYSHLSLDEKSIAYFKPLVVVDSLCEEKAALIEILSKMMPSEDFINLVRPYVPQKSKYDSNNSEEARLYEAQCATAKALANLDEPTKLIPLLGPFCQGDYLQASLKLLYWVMYGINEEQITSFVSVLIQRAVSARKHAVYLAFEILPQKVALDLFNVISTKESDVSVKKYIFQAVFKYFLKNPSDYVLDKVLTNITFVEKNDKKLLLTLAGSINSVPIKFRPVFVEHLWNFLDDIEKQDVKVLDYRRSVLSTVDTYDTIFFSTVKESFCQDVIKKHFFSGEDSMLCSNEIYTFVAKYLLAHNDEQHFQFVFNVLKYFKGLHWESNENNKIRCVYNFFDHVYKVYMEQDIGFLKLFKTYWEQVFSLEESFSKYVLLNLMVLYKDTSLDIAEFSKRVSKLFQELTLEYGPFISDLLVECTNTFFSIQALSNHKVFNVLNFALQLLNFEKNHLNCFIASKLIVNSNDEDLEVRSNIINVLKTVDNFAVRVRCHDLLKRLDVWDLHGVKY